ncbi:hypothetical protein GCM10010428_75230 [Actinosynnema pretiosum subsp. pretiosum]
MAGDGARYDIAVDGHRAFRFTPGDGATAFLRPDDAPGVPGHAVQLDGAPAKAVNSGVFEAVLAAGLWRVVDGGPEPLDADPVDGLVGDGRLLLVCERPPLPPVWPQYPVLPAGDVAPPGDGALLERVESGIAALVPEGWERCCLEFRAVGRFLEVEGVVVLGGQERAWAPPVMLGQWLHRLRVREFRNTEGAWYSGRVDLLAGGSATWSFGFDGPPQTVVPRGQASEHLADELRLLPRRPVAVPEWLWAAAGVEQQRAAVRALDPVPDEPLRLVRAFDVVLDGRGEAYRPMVGAREARLLLDYLEGAPLVLSSRGSGADLVTGEPDVVPLGYHTDGVFVWPSGVAHYLREHRVPPPPALVDHVRQSRYRLPDVPRLTAIRASHLAMGRPWSSGVADRELDKALAPAYEVITRCQTSPRRYRLGGHREGAWCLVPSGDRYEVYWGEKGGRKRGLHTFEDAQAAVVHLIGQLVVQQDELRYELDEELPAWQAPYQVVPDAGDPSLREFHGITLSSARDAVVRRYGSDAGNLVHWDGGSPPEGEFRRYRLRGDWTVVTALDASGSRVFVLPEAVGVHLAAGQLDDLTGHPGLPAVTDAMREQAAQVPGGWVWCADPDVDPRHVEGTPNAALLGAYRSGSDGVLTGEEYLNPDYSPSPRRRGFPEPLSELDVVLGYAAVGWVPHERVLPVVLGSRLILETNGNGGLRLGVDGLGRRFLAVYSAPGHVPEGAQAVRETTGRELVGVLAGVVLVVNPGGVLGIELPGDDLVAAAGVV